MHRLRMAVAGFLVVAAGATMVAVPTASARQVSNPLRSIKAHVPGVR